MTDDSTSVTAMQRELGRQLAALRRATGMTQQALAVRTGFSRSAVSLAEIGHQFPLPQFWHACDKALDVGGALADGADEIGAVRDAEQLAAAAAAQEARHARALAAVAEARERSDSVKTGATVQACPHCGIELSVVTTLFPIDP